MNTTEKLWVFSYGSNSSVQLRARVKNPELRAHPAYVNDWARIFCLPSKNWRGAVASLSPAPESQTYGGAVHLTRDELALLDNYEGGYSKVEITMTVVLEGDHVSVNGLVYICNSPKWTGPPSEQYLTAIHLNLREHWGEEQISSLPVAGVLDPTNACQVITFYEWCYPGSHALTLPALCVEVNALRESPWVMPRTINDILSPLGAVGIESAAQLAVAISCQERVVQLSKNLQANGEACYFSESVDHFKQVLRI